MHECCFSLSKFVKYSGNTLNKGTSLNKGTFQIHLAFVLRVSASASFLSCVTHLGIVGIPKHFNGALVRSSEGVSARLVPAGVCCTSHFSSFLSESRGVGGGSKGLEFQCMKTISSLFARSPLGSPSINSHSLIFSC